MKLIRILLVDDHAIVREGLKSMLNTQTDLQVVGSTGNGAEAITLIEQLQPDIVLLDLEMPVISGIDILKQLQCTSSTARVIILTAYGSDERILEAVRAGAKGYLLKEANLDEVLHALRTVATGGSLLQPEVTERLLGSIERMFQSGRVPILTERERTILTYIAQGLLNKTIAEKLHLAERTVKFHTTIIFQKLGVANRAEAVARALQDRLITL